jgi:hypothetical protein
MIACFREKPKKPNFIGAGVNLMSFLNALRFQRIAVCLRMTPAREAKLVLG